jgi:hypothetical protein
MEPWKKGAIIGVFISLVLSIFAIIGVTSHDGFGGLYIAMIFLEPAFILWALLDISFSISSLFKFNEILIISIQTILNVIIFGLIGALIGKIKSKK